MKKNRDKNQSPTLLTVKAFIAALLA